MSGCQGLRELGREAVMAIKEQSEESFVMFVPEYININTMGVIFYYGLQDVTIERNCVKYTGDLFVIYDWR